MNNNRVLQSFRLPARLTVEEAGALLGFHSDSIDYLAKQGILSALGAVDDVQIFFATAHIRRLCNDEKWLAKATNAVRPIIGNEMRLRNPGGWKEIFKARKEDPMTTAVRRNEALMNA